MWRYISRASVAAVVLLAALPVSSRSPRPYQPDCLGQAWDGLRQCTIDGQSISQCNDGPSGYYSFADPCSNYTRAALPPVQRVTFEATHTGQVREWIPKFHPHFLNTATLIASWTPLFTSNPGKFSPPEIGPFKLAYGQRWEVKRPQGQKVNVTFAPTKPGTFAARLYVWWEYRGYLEFVGVWDFHGTAITPPPPPPPPPPNCMDVCWTNLQECTRAQNRDCHSRYVGCVSRCAVDANLNPPNYKTLDLGRVPLGQTSQKPITVTNHARSFLGSSKTTLYISWTPLIVSDPGRFSPPQLGPFTIIGAQRKELSGGRSHTVYIDFRPEVYGDYEAFLYIWWHGKNKWYDTTHGLYRVVGTGVPPPAPGAGSTSGRTGGAESLPPWLFEDARAEQRRPPPLWKGLDRLGRAPRTDVETENGSRRRAVTPGGPATPITLEEMIPSSVGGLEPALHQPEAVIIGGNNAVESIAADYIDLTNESVQAVVLALRTRNDAYAHVYGVCARVKGAWLEDVRFASVSPPGSSTPASFWEATMTTRDENQELRREFATGFAVYVSGDRRRMTVDSRWLSEEYERHPDANGEILNFQIWAPDAATTAALRDMILERFRRRGAMEYRNVSAPSSPGLFIASASFDFGEARLRTVNRTNAEKTVELTAVTWSAANAQSQAIETFTRPIPPGSAEISIPLPGRLNGVIYISEPGGSWTDMVYIADGVWFSFGESGLPAWTAPDCPAPKMGDDDLPAAGCARIVTQIPANGWRGVGRSLATYIRDGVRFGAETALSFFAQGSRLTGEVKLRTVNDDGVYFTYTTLFTPAPEGRQITIPLSWFAGIDAAKGTRFDGQARIAEITWNIAGAPHPSTDLFIGNVYFTHDLVLDAAPTAPSTADTQGPYIVSARVPAENEGMTVTLAYRRGGNAAFTRVPMTLEIDVASASIPGQPIDSVVEWFVEVNDPSGRTATVPPDAPYDTYAFVTSARPALLVDDFDDALLRNRQGSAQWTFVSEAASSRAENIDGAVRFTYDVRAPSTFAGVVWPVQDAIDASPYDSLVLRVRGTAGGEVVKIGLGDDQFREHKIVLSKFLSGGLTSEWRDVRVPLDAFTTLDITAIEKLLVVVENGVGSESGSVDIDEIRFVASGAPLRLPIDHFDDVAEETALGGNVWDTTDGTAGITARRDSAARAGEIGAGCRITASGQNGSWAVVGFDLRGADLRALKELRFWMRGQRGGERPHVYLVSGLLDQTRRWVDLPNVTTSWQQFSIPLQDFAAQGVDLSYVTRLEFVWEWRDFSESVDLDEIEVISNN